eukprot:SAG11_NODE_9017_length_953_cov_1.018735_1_plen_110_part_01
MHSTVYTVRMDSSLVNQMDHHGMDALIAARRPAGRGSWTRAATALGVFSIASCAVYLTPAMPPTNLPTASKAQVVALDLDKYTVSPARGLAAVGTPTNENPYIFGPAKGA